LRGSRSVKEFWLISKDFITLKFFFRVFALTGSKDIRQGQDYQFSVATKGLQKALLVDFKLSGFDVFGAFVELLLKQQTVAPGAPKSFTFAVS
jgi:hypothetical protein